MLTGAFAYLQIWDTAGENQADLLDSYFWSNASGALIVCNLHQANCTKCLNFWQEKMHQVCCKHHARMC